LTKGYLEQREEDLIRRLEQSYDEFQQRIDEQQKARLADIEAEMAWLGDVTEAAFDPELNASLLLQRSVDLARAHDVPEENVIEDAAGVDDFMGVGAEEEAVS
jgi:hypothetical protein